MILEKFLGGIKMSDHADNLLTSSQLIHILVGILIGTSILYLPNSVIEISKQDAWISCILGAIYPLYLIFLANYMYKKYPKDNILVLSRKYFGRFLGTILNFIFSLYFLLSVTVVASGFANVFTIYATTFLKPTQIILVTLIVPAYISYKGIKPLGRICQLIFYLTFLLFLIPVSAIKYGLLLNIMPVFGSGITNILKGVKETAFSYSGMEFLFLIYPYYKNKKNFLKCSIIATSITLFVYTWLTFITIYYLGIDISPKFLWPVVTLSESIQIPIINSFRYIFICLWSLLILRCTTNFYYALSYGLSQIIKNINHQKFALLLYPLIFYLSTLLGPPTKRRSISGKLIPYSVLFNLIFISTIALLIRLKKDDAHGEK